ncbi:filamin-B isoform X1 [Lates japonicus]|uniref:Filamin-B isoform X1 n=1 Tax=Lates japonicus TaxID=270547 RepID=A0AAD3R6Y9_LATJO|nr:filamin-B isoform X1 [Lates japonicus]
MATGSNVSRYRREAAAAHQTLEHCLSAQIRRLGRKGTFMNGRVKTPKQRLLGWIQHKVQSHFLTQLWDWRNGARTAGALVDSCAPDWGLGSVKPVSATEAMQLADDCSWASMSSIPSSTRADLLK